MTYKKYDNAGTVIQEFDADDMSVDCQTVTLYKRGLKVAVISLMLGQSVSLDADAKEPGGGGLI